MIRYTPRSFRQSTDVDAMMRVVVLLLLAGCASAGYRAPVVWELGFRCRVLALQMQGGASFDSVRRVAKAQGIEVSQKGDSLHCTTNRWGW